MLPSKAYSLLSMKGDVNGMSWFLFGEEYTKVQGLIYPHPSYRAFIIKKRDGGFRLIEEPKKNVKNLQIKVLKLLEQFSPSVSTCVHGFVKRRSILTNAKVHSDRKPNFILNIDLKDFFPSISFFRVRGLLQANPFGFSYEVSTVLAHLCTTGGKLPQGAPTSPYLSNLICRSMDRELMRLAQRHRCIYTRYVDDLTFSFSVRDARSLPVNICALDGGLATIGDELRSIIKKHSFEINDKKTRISSRNTRQEVTGLTINQFPNVPRKFIDSVRGALHAWEKHGYINASRSWEKRIGATEKSTLSEMAWARQTRTGVPPRLNMMIWGKLLYIRMIRSEHNAIYSRLAHKYNDLVARDLKGEPKNPAPRLPVVFEVRDRADIEKAVYLIEWLGDAQIPGKPSDEIEVVGSMGTAFAYGRSNLLITCEHVLRANFDNGRAMADFESAKGAVLKVKNVRTNFESTATVIARDVNRDLAVLRIDGPVSQMRYFFRSNLVACSDMSVRLIGFPNWTPGRPCHVQSSTILSVFPKKSLKKFEVVDTIRKGNSGGPVTSDAFELLGIAQEGATQSEGNNECLSVEELNSWLDSLKLPELDA